MSQQSLIQSKLDVYNAYIAADLVAAHGGFLSFDKYDELMYRKPIISFWITGWGLGLSSHKRNIDKLCAFAACELGILKQTKKGYRVK